MPSSEHRFKERIAHQHAIWCRPQLACLRLQLIRCSSQIPGTSCQDEQLQGNNQRGWVRGFVGGCARELLLVCAHHSSNFLVEALHEHKWAPSVYSNCESIRPPLDVSSSVCDADGSGVWTTKRTCISPISTSPAYTRHWLRSALHTSVASHTVGQFILCDKDSSVRRQGVHAPAQSVSTCTTQSNSNVCGGTGTLNEQTVSV